MSLDAVSKLIKILERAGLVRRTVVGRERVCRLEPGPLRRAAAWLELARRGAAIAPRPRG